jgi:hypothetical protein
MVVLENKKRTNKHDEKRSTKTGRTVKAYGRMPTTEVLVGSLASG